jgi:hypothetical protein
MKDLYWFHSLIKGKNVGVCIVSEETEEKQKLKLNFIYPENDDVAVLQ